MVAAIDRKLLRDLMLLKGQVLTIALVVACGIASYVALASAWRSLGWMRDAYQERARFADVFVHLERAPASITERLEAVPGVAVVYTRVVKDVMLPLEALAEPAVGRVVSLPSEGEAPLNSIVLRTGRRVEPGRADEVLVSEWFAHAHGLGPGHRLPAVINGVRRELRIVGIAMSPEYILPVTGIGALPDARRFAVLWMDRGVIAPAFQLDGAFNDAAFRLQPGAVEADVIDHIDRLLKPYGGLNAYGRSKQLSNYSLSQELQQLERFATFVPAIFLAVAAFLLNVVLSRLVNLQRAQIATLKAIGYSGVHIANHYYKLVCIIVLSGALLGTAVGAAIGRSLTELYMQFFRFPLMQYRLDANVVTTGALVSLVAGTVGAFVAARQVYRMAPAEAMRPEAPAVYRKTLLERVRLERLLSPAARMVLREIERRPVRVTLSALGIALAVGIIVAARFSGDAFDVLLDVQFRTAQREDLAVRFTRAVPARACRSLAHVAGVTYAEGMRTAPVRFRVGHRWRDSVLIGHPKHARLQRVIEWPLREVAMPDEGLVLTRKLASILEVGVGDQVEVDILEGQRRQRQLVVVRLTEEMVGLQGHVELAYLNRLVGDDDTVSAALLSVDTRLLSTVEHALKHMPLVASVERRDDLIAQFIKQSEQTTLATTMILTTFGAIIAIGVVYNNARVVLSMRSRELASLRVLGFTRGEISAMLLGELAVQVALGLPLGLVVGTWMAHGIAATVDPEAFRFPVVIATRTYAFATFVTMVAAVASAFIVRAKLDRLDLIAVLKEGQ